uniref:Dimethylarginine dimethylaminohydrolase 2 n=1 Tax=Astyanax mexicanus TaxID=7994 RepID=A0A8B9H5X3_ASTMX
MANVCPYGRFTHAIVRGIPESFGQRADGGESVSVDVAKAQRQFGVLTGALRQKVGLQLIEIPADPELPESWRIEDIAVIQGDTALITRPFKQQRRAEADAVRRVMNELNLTVVEMGVEEGGSGGATLEGSDVLFTGREFFVGISKHTNHRGAEVLADTFRVSETFRPAFRPDLLNRRWSGGKKKLSEESTLSSDNCPQLTDHHYDVLSVSEDVASNCVYVRGPAKVDYLLHPTADECPNSITAFQKLPDYTLLPTACSEASKLGGALSSFCLLINRKPNYS